MIVNSKPRLRYSDLNRFRDELVRGFLSEIHTAGNNLFLHQRGLETTTAGWKRELDRRKGKTEVAVPAFGRHFWKSSQARRILHFSTAPTLTSILPR